MKYSDKYFMDIAIEEASKADSAVYPNPKVGCLIVKDNKIIGRGHHQKYGSAHAEELAFNSASKSLYNAIIYLTLEPCTHFGKRPPCIDLIIKYNFKKVVIANYDPNPVAEGGAEILRANGIKVVSGVLESKAKQINRRFFTYHEKGRPYVILKYASTLDGFLAKQNGESKWITGKLARQSVYKLRSECDAILVGSKTILNDNPDLSSHGLGKDPLIVVLNPNTSIPDDFKIHKKNPLFIKNGLTNNKKKNIPIILEKLKSNGIQSVLVEGGGQTISTFIESKLFDEIHLYFAPKFLGAGIPVYSKIGNLKDIYKLSIDEVKIFEKDVCIKYLRD